MYVKLLNSLIEANALITMPDCHYLAPYPS